MRMNRGTIILIAALLVVIVAVLVINNNQASAPGVTPTVAVATGPILPGVTADKIVHYEVRDNTSGNFTSLTKDSGGAWHIDGTNTLPTRVPDQSLIGTTAGQIVAINYNNTFQDDQLATFGLNTPAYTVLAQTSDNKLYTIYIGSKAPTSSGYYAVVETGTAPAATEAAAAPSAATAEATAEATSQVAKKIFKMLNQATAEASAATAQATAEATSQPPAAAVIPATAEAASAATAEATAEATANVVRNPGVTLTGKQTIYVVPQTVIDTLTKWITTPPYAPLPTPAPTNDTSLLAPPPTVAVTAPVAAATAEATTAPTAEATAEATAAATAGS